VLVPSFTPGADSATVNLVLWTWSERPPHAVTVIDDQQHLPRDASS